MQRSERLIRLTQLLVGRPAVVFALAQLAAGSDAARSSLSEDVALLRQTLEADGQGTIASSSGAGGGVRYLPALDPLATRALLTDMTVTLSDPSRLLPGGFLYMSDVLGDPDALDAVGRLFAAAFRDAGVNVVVTIETKGIAIAAVTARFLHVPLAIVRREHRVTEGAALSLHYVSGSERRIGTMSLSMRAMPRQARALVVDDFMRAGATVKAVHNLLAELSAEVAGTAVFMATAEPALKLVPEYLTLFRVAPLTETGPVRVEADGRWL